MSTLSRWTGPSMYAGSSSLPVPSAAAAMRSATPGPMVVMRSPSTMTSATPPPGKNAFRKAHTGGYHNAGTPATGDRGAAQRGNCVMAVASSARQRDIVYPEERPPWPPTILMGVPHVMALFRATGLVPVVLGFHPNTMVFFNGI